MEGALKARQKHGTKGLLHRGFLPGQSQQRMPECKLLLLLLLCTLTCSPTAACALAAVAAAHCLYADADANESRSW
jgi:hypothetical protein